MFGDLGPLPVDQAALDEITDNGALLGGASLFLLMRAFSSGAIALSGVEAISNGVPAFRPPEARNAARVLTWTGTILAALFCGVAALALQLQPTLSEDETILSTMGRAVFGDDNVLYYVLQFFTASILILSANTAFADFPRLSAVIASDGFLPRQLANRGDRLAFSNGIIALAVASAAPARRLPRRRHGARSAVRGRAVHELHAQPGRHGRAPLAPARAALAGRPGHQRPRRGGDGRRPRGDPRVEVHRGRVGPDAS